MLHEASVSCTHNCVNVKEIIKNCINVKGIINLTLCGESISVPSCHSMKDMEDLSCEMEKTCAHPCY